MKADCRLHWAVNGNRIVGEGGVVIGGLVGYIYGPVGKVGVCEAEGYFVSHGRRVYSYMCWTGRPMFSWWQARQVHTLEERTEWPLQVRTFFRCLQMPVTARLKGLKHLGSNNVTAFPTPQPYACMYLCALEKCWGTCKAPGKNY